MSKKPFFSLFRRIFIIQRWLARFLRHLIDESGPRMIKIPLSTSTLMHHTETFNKYHSSYAIKLIVSIHYYQTLFANGFSCAIRLAFSGKKIFRKECLQPLQRENVGNKQFFCSLGTFLFGILSSLSRLKCPDKYNTNDSP